MRLNCKTFLPVNFDLPGLSDPVDPIASLSLQLGVPVHVEEEEVVGPYEVEADTSGSQRQEHHLSAATLAVEVVDNVAAKLGRNLACQKANHKV